MKNSEAASWLEARGGSWYVRATSALCVVVAALGQAQVVVRAGKLTTDAIEDALESAVDRLRGGESRK
jgi:hypothetical protein